jgi:hypothetical protein
MRPVSSAVVAVVVAAMLGACRPGSIGGGAAETTQSLSSQIAGVTLRTALQQRYVGALNNGGGAVVATATAAAGWETFALNDINGATLESGDTVYIRAGNGQYLQAANGGDNALTAASTTPRARETFRVVKSGGSGTIHSGDTVGLQAVTSGNWISAENGGGGTVFAYGPAFGPWEQLTIGLGPTDAAATRISSVTLRTAVKGRFVGAQNNGGGAVLASATAAATWETFALIDSNGGTLESGDEVNVITGGGNYLQAANGGGSTLNAASTDPLAWETFRIVKSSGSGTIVGGDVVGLQTVTGGNWLSAESGGDGSVFAYGAALGAWEQFVVSLGETRWVYGNEAYGWRLVWSDEFDGGALDESKWSYEVQPPGWVNHELQSYTDHRRENARVENGNLVIEARRDGFGGEYSSARLKTQGKASWTYGRVEARIQVPSGWGTWPAFWMMPDNQSRGWPACGEIDIMEHVGYDQDSIHGTTHSQAYNWRSPHQRTSSTHVDGATTSFHIYAVEWRPDRIDFFVDGLKYFTSPNDGTGDDAWPFDKSFHIILNLAVGGDWGGARGVDPNIWPRQLLVDYVRVYQR